MERSKVGGMNQGGGGAAATDCLARTAERFVEEHVDEAFGVAHLARVMQVSRRTLERAFRDAFGEPPHVRIVRIRIARARQSRRIDPTLTLTAVAKAAGFSGVRQLRRAAASLGSDAFLDGGG